MTDNSPLAALLTAEKKAEALLEAIESQRLVRPGRTETEVDQDIYALAERSFGVKQHWHKRIVRSGPNTVRIFAENPAGSRNCRRRHGFSRSRAGVR